jgi:hypothetical protein
MSFENLKDQGKILASSRLGQRMAELLLAIWTKLWLAIKLWVGLKLLLAKAAMAMAEAARLAYPAVDFRFR